MLQAGSKFDAVRERLLHVSHIDNRFDVSPNVRRRRSHCKMLPTNKG